MFSGGSLTGGSTTPLFGISIPKQTYRFGGGTARQQKQRLRAYLLSIGYPEPLETVMQQVFMTGIIPEYYSPPISPIPTVPLGSITTSITQQTSKGCIVAEVFCNAI